MSPRTQKQTPLTTRVTNPLEAREAAVRSLMWLVQSAQSYDVRLRAAEMILEETDPRPGYDEDPS